VRGLLDCHSLNGIGPKQSPDPGERRKDIVLGNNGGGRGNGNRPGKITCPKETLRLMKESFEKAGFSVALNHPYAGGFITTHYGQPLRKSGRIAVQIEVNQDLFLASESLRILPKRLQAVKTAVRQGLEAFAGGFS
jgi:N-formylglutamate amidohydrolase